MDTLHPAILKCSYKYHCPDRRTLPATFRLSFPFFSQDPKQQTLFSFVESFVEDYAADSSTKLFERVASTSSKSNKNSETNTNTGSLETKRLKDVESESGSDARKRKPRCDAAVEKGSEYASTMEDNFDWFDGITDDDLITDEFQENTVTQLQSTSSLPSEPSAKRYRR